MAKRQREWAKRARLALIQALGAWCRACGETELAALTLEHPDGRTWDIYRAGSAWRISIYRREAAEGKVTVLCFDCNRKLGARNRYTATPEGARCTLYRPANQPDGVPF